MRDRPATAERGAALLTVLLLVAVIAVMAGGALERLRLAERVAGSAAAQEQARGYAEAAETLALTRVDGLLGQRPTRVSLTGGWSGHPFVLPLPGGGTAMARVKDGSNCFNLNGLVTQPAPGVYVANPAQMAVFARLMRLLTIPPQVAGQIAAGAADWIDTDAIPQPGGAEDPTYLQQDPPYRTAGALMADPSELRTVAGVTPALYAQLKPWLCTLPVAAPAPVNLDTLAPEQAPLAAMLAPDTLSIAAAQTALQQRPPDGWADAGGFWSAARVAGAGGGVQSSWFALRIEVAQGRTQLSERALIDASRLPARLVARQWGEDP